MEQRSLSGGSKLIEQTLQSIKFNIRTAIVGGINQNGIVKFGKICHLPRAGTALVCTVIKRATGARVGRP